MAVRIRQDGRILCAAKHPAEPGDTYIDDGLHYQLSVETAAIVTEPMYCDGGRSGHAYHGEWWWRNRVPADVEVVPFYLKRGAAASWLAHLSASLAKRMAARARRPVVGLDVVALFALVVVVVLLGARQLGMKRVYLRHNSPPFLSGIRGRRAYSSGGGVA